MLITPKHYYYFEIPNVYYYFQMFIIIPKCLLLLLNLHRLFYSLIIDYYHYLKCFTRCWND